MSPLSSIGLHYSFTPLRAIPNDLNESIELNWAALLLFPPGHSLQSSSLNNLALGLCDRFTQWGIPSDLDESIKLYQAALLLRPPSVFLDR
ncbi:hypothetical protein BDR07DRAFT_1489068 [Suillus spraguei]|nr:hypothetical protein BDR07DRAFT_1489068 [Suillus spraguei]